MDQKKEEVNSLAKKLGPVATVIAIANMNNGIGRFVKNQLDVAKKYEEEKVLKEKFGEKEEGLE